MSKSIIKKIIPFILIFTLVLPSGLGQILPVVASGNDGESVILTEETGEEEVSAGEDGAGDVNNSGEADAEEGNNSEETGMEEREFTEETGVDGETVPEEGSISDGESLLENLTILGDSTEEAVEEIYAVPLKSYGIISSSGSATESFSVNMPAWNERAMLKVASGGAVSVTFQIYSTIPYDYLQVLKWEESEKYDIGTAYANISDNKELADIKMGTFTDGTDAYLGQYPAMEQYFSEETNDLYDQTAVVSRDSQTGYTYLTLNLENIDDLMKKLVIKSAFYTTSATVSRPANTSYLVFDLDSRIRIDIEEYIYGETKSVQISDARGNSPKQRASNLVDTGTLNTVQKLFSTVLTEAGADEGAEDTLTIKGMLNEEAFEGTYGVIFVRELINKPIAEKTASDILYYYHPYYNTNFRNLDISGYQFELTFDLTAENLVFGVPLSIKTKDGAADYSTYDDAKLDTVSSNYVMLHVLPGVAETIVMFDESGEVRLTTDSSVISEDYSFTVDRDSEELKSREIYRTVETIAAADEDGIPYFKPYYYEIKTASGSAVKLIQNVEIAVKVPEGWNENEIYAVNRFYNENETIRNNYYKPSDLLIKDGYIIFQTDYSSGEIYLYLQDTPADLNALENGLYRVKIAAMHSSQDGRMSMANAALVKDAFLKVSTDGDGSKVKELYLDFQVMYIGDTAGYLSNVGTANTYGVDVEAAEIAWGNITDYVTVEGSDDLLVDFWHKANFDYDLYLVKSAKITLQDYTGQNGTNALYQNYYPVYFEVPPMDMDPTDGIGAQVVRLMVNHCVKLEDSTALPTYQKTVLKKAILEGKAINGEVYTTESFNALKDVIAAAENVYSSNPHPETIKNNAEAIRAAINALVVDESKLADKTQLEAKLSEAKAIPEANYTASSYLELQTAITAAEKIYKKEAARQAEVDAQVVALQAVIDALVPVNLGATPPSQLPDGKYTIPIRLWHAIKDSQSMGDAAVVSKGILEIKDGKATLQMEMLPLTFAGLTGYLMQFNILTDYTIGTSGYPENYTRNPAAVLETHDYIDQYNREDSKDEICRGQKYPKTLAVNVTLPETAGVNYTWVHVYVPVMGELDSGDQEARLRLDYTAIAKKGEPTISLDHNTLELTPGATKTLAASLTDSEEAIVWATDNSTAASVDNNGLVTALAPGTAVITASAGDISASCVVTVKTENSGGGTGNPGTPGDSDESLEDGTYSIPVKLWHASKNQASMGNAALSQSGKLVIKNGEGTLYITFQKMNYAGQSGYLSELNPSAVISTYSVVDRFNSETSTDERCRGQKYPKRLAVPVVPGEEFTDVSVYVPVMGSLGVGEQDARLKLNYASAKYISSSTDLENEASGNDLYFKEGEAVEGTGADSEGTAELVIDDDGIKYFYENGEKITSKLINYRGRVYYAGEDGAVVTSRFVTYEGRKYYAGESGAMETYVMITENNKSYYAGKGGVIVTSVLFSYKGKNYYAYKTGRIAVSAVVTYEGDKYYAGEDGAVVTSKMITYKGKKYYAYKTGILAASAMVNLDGKKYYAYKTGRIATSAMVTYKGKKYYAYQTGRIATSAMVTYKGKKYYAYQTGRIAASDIVTYYGKKYYAYKTGRIATSDIITFKDSQYYTYKTGRIAASVLVTYKDHKYYAGKDGILVKSKWVTIDGTRCYFNKTGKLVKTL